MHGGGSSFLEQEARFAARIRLVRQHRGITHTDLGNRAGISRMAVSNIETGKRRVQLADALALSAALEVSLTEMVSPEPLVLRTETRVD